MKPKTISKVIRTKMSAWINTLPKDLRSRVADDIIVTGGSIASMFLREQINDFDVYFQSPIVCSDVLHHYWGMRKIIMDSEEAYRARTLGKAHIQIFEESVQSYIPSSGVYRWPALAIEGAEMPIEQYQPMFLTSNALSLSDKVQLITRFCGDAAEIHRNFDFIHATNYWTYNTGLVVKKEALLSLITRELLYQGSRYPLSSIIRARKFVQRNWTINAGQYLKMIMQCGDLDLKDPIVLREQLVGVDLAYFEALLDALDKDKPITTDYICELVDRIFEAENIGDGDE